MCTSAWSSANQISNFKFSAFFRVLFALWPLKYPRPKSQQAPRVSTELEMVINLLYSFIPLQKILQKGVNRTVENPQKSANNIKMSSNAPNNFYRRMRRRNACWGDDGFSFICEGSETWHHNYARMDGIFLSMLHLFLNTYTTTF